MSERPFADAAASWYTGERGMYGIAGFNSRDESLSRAMNGFERWYRRSMA